jgi:outer membrane murein-binding lipoprotein Lpp
MKLILTQATLIEGQHHDEGKAVDVHPVAEAKRLINLGIASPAPESDTQLLSLNHDQLVERLTLKITEYQAYVSDLEAEVEELSAKLEKHSKDAKPSESTNSQDNQEGG